MSDILPPRYPSPMPQIPPNPVPKLDLLLQEDEEVTIKMKVPPHLLAQTRGPNYGMIGALVFCLAFWGSIAYLIWR